MAHEDTDLAREDDDYDEAEEAGAEETGAASIAVASWPATKPETERLVSVLEEMRDGSLNPAPPWQRRPVWSEVKKAALIESIFLGIPLPLFYFADAEVEKAGEVYGIRECVDGQQRLHAVADFAANRLPIPLTSRVDELRGKTYAQLPPNLQKKFTGFGLSTATIPMMGPISKFDLYRRINEKPTPLSSQELRNAAFWEEAEPYVRTLISEAQSHAGVLRVTNADFSRMRDVEFVTRLAAFIRSGPGNFPNKRLNDFLNAETEHGGRATGDANRKILAKVAEAG